MQRGVVNVSKFTLVEDCELGHENRASILEDSALRGFDGFVRDDLKRLLHMVPGALDGLRHPPSTDRAIATLLFKALFPGIAKDRIDELNNIRAKLIVKERAANAGVFLSANLEHGAGCIDEKDFTAMSSVISEHRKNLKETRDRIDRERSERASMVGVVMPPREAGCIVSIEWAQSWMPGVGVLSKDDTLHMRWKCTYPRKEPPRWVTKAWGR